MSDVIVGIDLGTTNSEVAAFHQGEVRILGPGDKRILPSCVGFSATGELLVGEAARNQQALYPERTVRSIKRKMGLPDTVALGNKKFTAPEISAFLLNELAEWAAQSLSKRPSKAVITVPSYFSDAQRNATREAGALAGLEVVRILNEPTAASLAYGYADGARHTALVYDLGGGTFDVSVVMIEGDVTEVLASHGNNRLGGDDFDDLLVERLASAFLDEHGISLHHDPAARARLWWAAEEAKKKLSFEPFVKIREESLLIRDGCPLHLDLEVSRREYERLIQSLVESTLDSVSKTLRDAGRRAADMDAILLVGGSTRTPLVTELLIQHTGLTPRQDVHPDLCVALGAGVLASRLAGQSISRILVDVSPFSFGISYLGEREGNSYEYCYRPIIRRNTPLPLTRTESYFTGYPFQTAAKIEVYQGDDEDALRNILVGDFMIEGLTAREEPVEILCRMRLDLDGILEVTAVEKHTGKSKRVTISNALKAKSAGEIAAARKRLQDLQSVWWAREDGDEESEDGALIDAEAAPTEEPQPYDGEITQLLARSRGLLKKMHGDDREEAIGLHEQIQSALDSNDSAAVQKAAAELRELLFFVEGESS